MASFPTPYGNLFWCDIETNGFDEKAGRVLEVALVITTPHTLELIDECVVQVGFPKGEEQRWNDWCRITHTENGLVADCQERGLSLGDAEQKLATFANSHILNHDYSPEEDSTRPYRPPVCGSGIGFDRRWLEHHMPQLMRKFSYRNVDVSTFYELLSRSPVDISPVQQDLPDYPHRAYGDVLRSIELLRRYKALLNF